MHVATAVSPKQPFLPLGRLRLIAENEPIFESPFTFVRVYAVIRYPKVQCLLALVVGGIVAIVEVAAASDDIANVFALLYDPRKGCLALPPNDLCIMVTVPSPCAA